MMGTRCSTHLRMLVLRSPNPATKLVCASPPHCPLIDDLKCYVVHAYNSVTLSATIELRGMLTTP